MSTFFPALWAEGLKARRSKVPWLAAVGFCLAPLVAGLFMVILKDPEKARQMGLITAKAQLTAGTADWPSLFSVLGQAIAVGGALLFSLVTAWVFGREFSDHTAKDLLAVPTPREATVAAKFVVITVWVVGLSIVIFGLGLVAGAAVGLPGWSPALFGQAAGSFAATALLTLLLMPPVAFFASMGRGFLPPMGWALLTLFLAQVLAAMGWGGWCPWSVPALLSEAAGPHAELIGLHSYLVVLLTCVVGATATFVWWRRADQVR